MPTIFSHAAFASALGYAYRSKLDPARFWVLTSLCAVLPDADVVAFAFGIKYNSMLGHRGITHSLAFAVLLGVVVATFCFNGLELPRWKLALYFAAVTFSHPLLDMLTDGGLGVALFAPFSNERFFAPWRPIEVSPIGMGFFSDRGLAVIASEIIWIWVPGILVAATALLVRRIRR